MKTAIIFILTFITANVFAFGFKFNMFPSKTIKNFGTYRAWSDGMLADSCKNYKNPTDSSNYKYSGEIGDGLYKLSTNIIVYCDMTTYGGGWTLVYKDASNNSPNGSSNNMSLSSTAYGSPDALRLGVSSYKLNATALSHTQVLFRSETGSPVQSYENTSAFLVKTANLASITGNTNASCGPLQFDNSGCEMAGMDFDYYSITGGAIAKGVLGYQTSVNAEKGTYWFGDTVGGASLEIYTAYSFSYRFMWHNTVPPFPSANALKGSVPNVVYRGIFLR